MRTLVATWELQRIRDAKAQSKAAKATHNEIWNTRKNAGERRAANAATRQKHAQGFREELKQLDEERKTTVLATAASAKAAAQHRYDMLFVPDAFAERVVASAWGAPDLTISDLKSPPKSPGASKAEGNDDDEGDDGDAALES